MRPTLRPPLKVIVLCCVALIAVAATILPSVLAPQPAQAVATTNQSCFTVVYNGVQYDDGSLLPPLPVGQNFAFAVDWSTCIALASTSALAGYTVVMEVYPDASESTTLEQHDFTCVLLSCYDDNGLIIDHTFTFNVSQPALAVGLKYGDEDSSDAQTWGAHAQAPATPTPTLPSTPTPTVAPTPPPICPSTDLLTNCSFENGGAGWQVWAGAAGTNAGASFNEAKWGAHTGSWYRAHWKASAYQVATYQAVTIHATGDYIVDAWVETSCHTATNFAVKNVSTNTYFVSQPLANCIGSWTHVQLPSIHITANTQVTVEFVSNTAANEWVRFDDVSLANANSCAPSCS